MKFIIGKKLDMTQVWKGDKHVAVTRIEAGPCIVVQVKGGDKDGYRAIQLGFGERKAKNINKPQQGHMKGLGNFKYLREFRLMPGTAKGRQEAPKEAENLKRGDVIDASTFAAGDVVKISGTSKGKGFKGVVKRHGFHGQDKTHGTKDQVRMPGSIGSTGPQRVFKGVRMAGRMGGDRVTTANLEIIEVDKENNILLVKGAVPGARNSMVLITGEGELVATRTDAEETVQEVPEAQGNEAQTENN